MLDSLWQTAGKSMHCNARFLVPRNLCIADELGSKVSRLHGQGHGRPEGAQTTFRTRECGHEPAFEENFILRNLIRGLGT